MAQGALQDEEDTVVINPVERNTVMRNTVLRNTEVRNTAVRLLKVRCKMRRMGVPAANEPLTDGFRWGDRSRGDANDKWMQIQNTNTRYKIEIQNTK